MSVSKTQMLVRKREPSRTYESSKHGQVATFRGGAGRGRGRCPWGLSRQLRRHRRGCLGDDGSSLARLGRVLLQHRSAPLRRGLEFRPHSRLGGCDRRLHFLLLFLELLLRISPLRAATRPAEVSHNPKPLRNGRLPQLLRSERRRRRHERARGDDRYHPHDGGEGLKAERRAKPGRRSDSWRRACSDRVARQGIWLNVTRHVCHVKIGQDQQLVQMHRAHGWGD